MKPGIIIVDAQERNRQNPVTYPIPTDEQKHSIQKDDLVKIAVEGFHVHLTDKTAIDGERFWVSVEKIRSERLRGTVANDLHFTQQHGLRSGDNVSFEFRHIIDIETVEQQEQRAGRGAGKLIAIGKNVQPSEKFRAGMKSGITLINGADRNRKHPDLFQVPSDQQKHLILPGDLVKIGAEDHLDRAGGSGLTPERFWTRITKVSDEGLEGVVTSNSPAAEHYGLYLGETVRFEPRHVLDIETVEQQAVAKLLEEQFVSISAEVLENKLPDEPRIRCELDCRTHLLIGRTIGAVNVAILLRSVVLEAAAGTAESPYIETFRIAAKKLGFVPDGFEQNDSPKFCRLIVTMPIDVEGYELISRVRESIASVHAEAKRLLEGEPPEGSVPATDGRAVSPADA